MLNKLFRKKNNGLFGNEADEEKKSDDIATHSAKVIAVGGGKGGVGKSLLATNIGIKLAEQKKRVLLLDADLGAGNLHTFVRAERARSPLSAFIKGEFDDVGMLISPTEVSNLDIISAANDSLDVANQSPQKVARLKRILRMSGYDKIIIDLGPGTGNNTLDMFLSAQSGLVVTTPEPTSMENSYRFLKCLFLRRIGTLLKDQNNVTLRGHLENILYRTRSRRPRTIANVLDELRELDHDGGQIIQNMLGSVRIYIIVNQTLSDEDRFLGDQIERACFDYFGVRIQYLGHVNYSKEIIESVRRRKPFTVEYGDSRSSKDLDLIVDRLVPWSDMSFRA